MGKGTYLGGSTILRPGQPTTFAEEGGWITRPLRGKKPEPTEFHFPDYDTEKAEWAPLSSKAKRRRLNSAVMKAGLPPLPTKKKARAAALKEAVALGVLLPDGRPNPDYAKGAGKEPHKK